MQVPIIAVSNDDGVEAPGLRALCDELRLLGDVWVVAPNQERSATSHGISLHDPMRCVEIAPQTFSLDGLPADCMYVALNHILPRRPDLVVSGINNGPNLGTDILYSGTVGAAMEGALNGIPAIAVSLCLPEIGDSKRTIDDFRLAAECTRSLGERLLKAPPEPGLMFNMNVPANLKSKSKDFRVTRLGVSDWENAVEARKDPRGKEYLWIGGRRRPGDKVVDSDNVAITEDVISVTPVHFDLTAPQGFQYLRNQALAGMNRLDDGLDAADFNRVSLPKRKLGIE